MTSYYHEVNGEMESGEQDDHRSQVRGGWESSGADSLSRGSPENPNWHTPTQRNLDGWVQGTENYEVTSDNMSDRSWWRSDSWSWHSWENSSRDGSNENWVYVSRRDRASDWRNDPWHRWHADGTSWRGGRGQCSGQSEPDDAGLSEREGGAADQDDLPRGDLPSGKVVSVHEKVDREEEKKNSGKITSSYPPVFRAKQGENYRDWKRAVKFWMKGEGTHLPTSLVGPRVMVQLRDRAAQLVKHLEPEDVDGKEGLQLIFDTLEASPLLKQNEKHRVDWHRRRLLSLNRLPGESLESYITRASLYRNQLQGLDASLSMGERFYVGHLLDHARLTRRDKAMVKTHAGTESENAITSALVELSGELEGESGFPIGQAEPQLGGAQGEEHLVQRGLLGGRFNKSKAALVAELVEDEASSMAPLEQIPENDNLGPGEDSCEEVDLPSDVLHVEHEALALQFKAKQKMAEARKMRSFFKKDNNGSRKPKDEQMRDKPCFACGEFGHWIRECPKVKAAMSGGNQVLMTSTVEKPADSSQEWDLLASLCQRAPTDVRSASEVYMVGAWGGPKEKSSSHATSLPHDTLWSMRELSKAVILDLGCMRNVAGVQWANDIVLTWKQEGRWFRIVEENEVFKFGDGNTLDSKYRLQLEATFGAKRVMLGFSVVPGTCPPLLSKKSHSLLGVVIDCVHDTLSSKKLGIKAYGLKTTEGGHYMMKIDEFQHIATEHEPLNLQLDAHEEVGLILDHGGSVAQEAFNAQPSHRSIVQPYGVSHQSSTMPDLQSSGSPHSRLSRPVGGRSWLCEGECRGFGKDGRTADQGARSSSDRAQAGSQEHGGDDSCHLHSGEGTSGRSPKVTARNPIRASTSPALTDGSRDSCRVLPGGGGGVDCGGDGDDWKKAREVGQVKGQETGDGSTHWSASGLPFAERGLEQRLGDEYHEKCGEPPVDPAVEEVSVAAACEKSSGDRGPGQIALETQSSLDELDDWHGGGSAVGPFRSNETEAKGSGGGSEMLRMERPQRGLQQRFKESIRGMKEIFAAMAKVSQTETRWMAMEIFAGCCRFTQVASSRDGWCVLPPIDLQMGHNLHDKKVQQEVIDCIIKYEPDLVTLSPRCGPWSQFQRLNKNPEKVMADREEDLPLWRFARKVWDIQDKGNRLVLTENPWQSEALKLNFMEARPNLWRARVCQCAYGLRDVVNGKLHQKKTALDVNNESMRDYLEESGVCEHQPGEHQPIEGNVFFEGRTWRRSQLAARWTREMCVKIMEAAEFALTQPDDAVVPRKLSEERWQGTQHYVLPVEQLEIPEAEVRKQLGKVDWRGGRYDYVFFEGVARQAPYRIRQALAHLHVALGHPSLERLQRMLLVSGANNIVLNAAKGLKCQICEAVRPPGAEPKISAERVTRFNDKVLADSFYVWDLEEQRFNVTHMIDSLTEYHIGMASAQPNSTISAELLQARWCSVFGPPQLFQTDGGKEFEDVVERITRLMDFRHEVIPPSAKWRQGQVERHGAIVKLMLMRVIHSQQIRGLEQVRLATTACFAAKNRLSNKMGLSPLQAVTGRNTNLPQSVMEQLGSGHVKFAVNEELDVKDSLRRAERIRAAAVDSFHWIDSNEVLRRALHSRSRPPKLELIQEGTTVYVHSPPPHRRGQARRLQDHSSWDGPGLVVCVERHRDVPNRIWVRIRAKVRSYPLEKIRLATPDEMLGSSYIVQMLEDMSNEMKEGKLMVESDERKNQDKPPAEQSQPENEAVDAALRQMDEARKTEMNKRLKRMELLNDVPEGIRQRSQSSSSTSMSTPESKGLTPSSTSTSEAAIREKVARDKRRQHRSPELGGDPMEEDEECDPVSDGEMAEEEPSRLTLQEKTDFFQQAIDDRQGKPSKLGEARLRGKLEKSVRKMRNIKNVIQKGRAATQRLSRTRRHEERASDIMVMYEENEMEADQFEDAWRDAYEDQKEHDIFWSGPVLQEVFTLELENMKKQKMEQQQEDCDQAKLVTGKARLEYNWGQLENDWKKAFREPLIKAVRVYFDHEAVQGVPAHKLVDNQRILSSRFVLTNKGEPALEKAVLKARWVLGGHKDPDIGRFPTLAPTASTLAHNLINLIATQMQWPVQFEDVTAAFLQGHKLPPEREVYVRLPKGYPDYILEFIAEKLGKGFRSDVLQLTKGGFGLPESPRLWYMCYKDTLEKTGMKEVKLSPGVFVAHHRDGRLRAVACIHVDDTRYCGDETSQEIWDQVHAALNFGDYRKATDGWVKFCGRWEKQNAETFEFEYCMDNYAVNLEKMKNEESEGVLTSHEKKQMASIIGQLNWMARQGRFDLSYGVSHVQQLMARGERSAIDWLNKLVYRAKQNTIQKISRLEGEWDDLVVLSASDAAFGAQPGGYSQGGLVVAVAEKKILEGEGKLNIVEACSMKIQRVVRCSMSAEISMAATAFEHGDFVRAAWSELVFRDFNVASWKTWSSRWPHYLVIDAKTGYDVLNNDSQTSDRKIQIDLAVLKQALVEGHSNFVRWVPGRHMLADAMTKWSPNGALNDAMARGIWSLQDTPEAMKLRSTAAQKRKVYRKQNKPGTNGGMCENTSPGLSAAK